MDNYEKRLRHEHEDLFRKLDLLEGREDEDLELSPEHERLLDIQLNIMKAYLDVLNARLDLIEKEKVLQ